MPALRFGIALTSSSDPCPMKKLEMRRRSGSQSSGPCIGLGRRCDRQRVSSKALFAVGGLVCASFSLLASVPGHLHRFRDSLAVALLGRRSDRASRSLTRTSERESDREARQPLGVRASATMGGGLGECMGRGSHRTGGDGSYAAVTRGKRTR
jgi:hypothetical protein